VCLTSLVLSLPVFVFSSPYAAVAGLTIAHGLQYLLLTSKPAVWALFSLFVGAVMAHFVGDAGLWRMRETVPRAFLGSRLAWLTAEAARP
jgi:hypothetical protein